MGGVNTVKFEKKKELRMISLPKSRPPRAQDVTLH